MEPLFPSIPESAEELAALSDEDLTALRDTLRERVAEVFAGRRDPEVVGERTLTEVEAETAKVVEGVLAIDAELAARDQQDDQYETKMAELAAKAGVETKPENDEAVEPEAESKDDGEPELAAAAEQVEEPEVEEKPKAKTAAAVQRTPRRLPAARSRHKPIDEEDASLGLRVTSHAAGLGGMFPSMQVLDRETLGEFFNDIVLRSRLQPGQKTVLAHASYRYPRELYLSDGPDSYLSNSEKIRNVCGPQALVASGENCAPFPPRYELPGFETAARPVRGANPTFQAARGGVQVGVTPKMGDYADATGVVTAADNAAGGTGAVKGCMRIICPDFSAVSVDSIYHCTEADNLASMAYPELMARIADLVMAEQARLADSKLLQAIKDGSTAVTAGAVTPGGGWYQFLGAVNAAASGIRSRNRMPVGSTMNALFPAWIIDYFLTDFGRALEVDGRPTSRAGVEAAISGLGINATYYLDGPSDGDGQIFAPQSPGALIDFPDTIQAAIYPPGSWLNLDAGELQLGLVRDSTLNSTNDHQIFGETWENIAFVGVESLWLTLTACPSGAFAAGDDASALCGT